MAYPAPRVRAWRPAVAGVAEVLHAYYPTYDNPMHVHDTWTLVVADVGTSRYHLGRREGTVDPSVVNLLPPNIAHGGQLVTRNGFLERTLYLDADRIDVALLGRAVDHPDLVDPELRAELIRTHRAMTHPGDELEAESRLALIVERLTRHLVHQDPVATDPRGITLARRLRDLLGEHLVDGVSLEDAGQELGTCPSHLIRVFRREYGIPPHRYLTARRIDNARKLLLAGERAADVAVAVGFYDQAHLTRHFRRVVKVTPGQYASEGGRNRTLPIRPGHTAIANGSGRTLDRSSSSPSPPDDRAP